jgi:hypothetical protein
LNASKPINSAKNNQEAAGSETLASIKVKTNKTTVARTLEKIITTLFYNENESRLLLKAQHLLSSESQSCKTT